MPKSESDSNFSVRMRNKKKNSCNNRKTTQKFGDTEFRISAGKWTLNQIKQYIEFLKLYKAQISSFAERREIKIFKLMSNFIKTRTSDQCRSHHQKVQKIHP